MKSKSIFQHLHQTRGCFSRSTLSGRSCDHTRWFGRGNFRSATGNALVAFDNFREAITHDRYLRRCLKPHVDGVNPGPRIVAKFHQIFQIILEGNADTLINNGRSFRRYHHRRLIHSFRHEFIQICPDVEAIQCDVIPVVVLENPSISDGKLNHAFRRVNVNLGGF